MNKLKKATSFTVIIEIKSADQSPQTTLLSLESQTVPPTKVILIAKDSDSAYRQQAQSNFKKYFSLEYIREPQLSTSAIYNKILQNAPEELLAALENGCTPASDWIEKMIEAHRKYPNTAIIQGRILAVPETNSFAIIERFNQQNLIRDNMLGDRNLYWDWIAGRLKKDFEILVCDSSNLSLKVNRIRRLHLKFNESDKAGSDFEFAKRLLSEGEHIFFYPKAVVYKQVDNTSYQTFLREAWHKGKSSARVVNNWPSEYHPRTKKASILRFLAFVYYCIRHQQFLKLPFLTFLFLAYQFAFEKGRRDENKISQNSLSLSAN